MIESIQFKNFKVLRDAKLPLGRCTVLVGPNGSGKSTVLQALTTFTQGPTTPLRDVVTAGLENEPATEVSVNLKWGSPYDGVRSQRLWQAGGPISLRDNVDGPNRDASGIRDVINHIRVYALEASAIASPVPMTSQVELARDGKGLAGVLSRLQDREPERFEALCNELSQWLPEFDRIALDWDNNHRVFFFRTREGHYRIPAKDLSQGTLIALVILTVAYLPEPPSLVALEEPDRGIHPRLLRHVQDALYRLAYPESCGESREPVQVIATTHSPYFLDLFKEHPEEVVIAKKMGQEVRFERLSERADINEILSDAPLGEAWYSGVLGGVPTEP